MRFRHIGVLVGMTGIALAACSGDDPSVSAGDLSPEMHEAYLGQIAQMYQIEDPPSVAVVRIVGPDEQLELVAECMQEGGWPETKVSNGGLQYEDLPEQEEAMNGAFYTCFASYPLAEEFLADGREQYEELYNYFVDDLKPCLEDQGLEITDPPSLESWLAVAETGSPEYWDPTLEIPDVDFAAIQEVCPQNPDS